MSTTATDTAKDAINYVLERIRDDENARYHMGAFTETFARLRAAHSALNGISEDAIDEAIFSLQLRRTPVAKKLDEIRNLLNNVECKFSPYGHIIKEIQSIIEKP